MGDVVDDIEAINALRFEEVHRLAFLLTENRDQHVGAGDLLLARGLYVKHCTLQDALKA